MEKDLLSNELLRFKKYCESREDQKYACSYQTVICAIVGNNWDKIDKFLEGKEIVGKYATRSEMRFYLNNGEIWVWKERWTPNNVRGIRFYKLAIDSDVELETYLTIRNYSSIYCCSVEIL